MSCEPGFPCPLIHALGGQDRPLDPSSLQQGWDHPSGRHTGDSLKDRLQGDPGQESPSELHVTWGLSTLPESEKI